MSAEEGKKEHELYEQRLKSAEAWRSKGQNPFANGFRPQHLAADLRAAYEPKTPEELEQVAEVFSLAGRLVGNRSFGKFAFVHLQDRSGALQLQVRKDLLNDAFDLYKLVDLGDFIGVEGKISKSKTGELTLVVSKFVPLTKALRAPPGKFNKGDDAESKAWAEKQAMADTEQRYRQRYLDLLANDDVRQTFVKRTRLVQFIRRFLDQRGYLEVETPMMHSLVSGAAARPFITHHNTYDIPLFMRIAPELHLKRLVVGGFERVYEINRNFRNEGVSTRHNPEFTMLEFYEAFATYEDLMTLTEEMISQAAVEVTGNSAVKYGALTIDFKAGWPRIPMATSICQKVEGLTEADFDDAEKLRPFALKGLGPKEAEPVKTMNAGELMGFLFEKYVEDTLVQPTFITQFPVEVSPLARRNDQNPKVTDRFELFVAGREIANAFSELNDPIDQKQRFQAQVDAKARGQQETMDFDEDYIRALEHGLPPTAGEGIGIDRLAMLFTDSQSIRDVILFPLLKPQSK